MSQTKSIFSRVREQLAEQAQEAAPRFFCRWCNQETPKEVLSQLGARCRPCYEEFLSYGLTGKSQRVEGESHE